MKCPYCKKEVNRENMVLEMCKSKEYSLSELADKLFVRSSSVSVIVKKLETEGKLIVIRNGKGRKILIKTAKGGVK